MKKYIEENTVDMALLDIEIGDKSGISVGKYLLEYQPFASLIFITFYKKYLEQANLLDPVGFLEKPVQFNRLDKLFCKIAMAKEGKNAIEVNNTKMVTLKQYREEIELRESEIFYFKRYERKLKVVGKQTMLINSTLLEMNEKLSDMFVQISRDIIVNKREVIKLEHGKITMSNGDSLEIPFSTFDDISRKIRT